MVSQRELVENASRDTAQEVPRSANAPPPLAGQGEEAAASASQLQPPGPAREGEAGSTSLGEALAEREALIATMQVQLSETQEALRQQEAEGAALRRELSLALARYRSALLAGVPELPEEMIQGETVQALEASFARARSLLERVRQELQAKLARERVPAGAPPRRTADLSALSPREKITLGLHRLPDGAGRGLPTL